MATLRAKVESELLVWARVTRGLLIEEAAKRIGVSEDRVRTWERGETQPTVKQLRKASNVYQRAMGFFFLPEPPEEDEVIRDFRGHPKDEVEAMSPALRLEIRLARERRLDAIELAAELRKPLPHLSLTAKLEDDPTEVAKRIRALLGVSIDEQTAWSSEYDAFNSWRSTIEHQGVLVFQTGGQKRFKVSPKEVRGFSISDLPLPVVVANSKDAPTARCFTLMHELTHVLLRNGGLCDFHERRTSRAESDRVEVFCNRVAAATLVPEEELIRQVRIAGYQGIQEWRDHELAKLARKFWVSWEVILLRLLTVGRTTQKFYEAWRERLRFAPPAEAGFLTPVKRVVMRHGRLFPRLALGAYHSQQITLSDLSHLLGEGPQHIQAVMEMVFDDRYGA